MVVCLLFFVFFFSFSHCIGPFRSCAVRVAITFHCHHRDYMCKRRYRRHLDDIRMDVSSQTNRFFNHNCNFHKCFAVIKWFGTEWVRETMLRHSKLTIIAILELVLSAPHRCGKRRHMVQFDGHLLNLNYRFAQWFSLPTRVPGHYVTLSIPFRINLYVFVVRERQRQRHKHFDPVYEELFRGVERFSHLMVFPKTLIILWRS